VEPVKASLAMTSMEFLVIVQPVMVPPSHRDIQHLSPRGNETILWPSKPVLPGFPVVIHIAADYGLEGWHRGSHDALRLEHTMALFEKTGGILDVKVL
jgi:hypothetical protein